MKRLLILMLCSVVLATPAFGWGRLGHTTIAKIAEDHLTPKAKKQIARAGYRLAALLNEIFK